MLLSLEGENGFSKRPTRRRPPHYHIALCSPSPTPATSPGSRTVNGADGRTYRVARGDTLWEIARKHSTTVNALKRENDLRGNQIRPGQVLQVPD